MKKTNLKTAVSLFCGGLVMVAALLPVTGSATNTVSAFGFVFEAKEGSGLSFDEAAGVTVWPGEPGTPPVNDFVSSLSSNKYGVRVLVGEAQMGVFGYPNADFENEGYRMEGIAYGSVNGVTNQEISSIQARRDQFAAYTLTVNLSRFGCSRLHYTLFQRDELVGETTAEGAEGVIKASFNNTWPNPITRVNPYWRMPCGDVGVMIEFSSLAQFTFPGQPSLEFDYGNRIFIRPVDPTNSVEYLSHVDVYADNTLPNFNIIDGRMGMFGHPHQVVGTAMFQAAGGRLSLVNLPSGMSSEIGDGVAIELDETRAFSDFGWLQLLDGVNLFEADLEPVELADEGALLALRSTGVIRGQWGAMDNGSVLGTACIVQDSGSIFIEAYLTGNRVQAMVYNQGQLAGTMVLPEFVRSVTLSGNPRVIGCGVRANTTNGPAGYSFRLDQPTVVSSGSGNTLTGDEVRMQALTIAQGVTNSEPVVSVNMLLLTAGNLSSFTITNERRQNATLEIPSLTIRQAETNIIVSWLDPNHIFSLESAPTPSGPFWWVERSATYANNIASVAMPLANANRIFRLNTVQVRQPVAGRD